MSEGFPNIFPFNGSWILSKNLENSSLQDEATDWLFAYFAFAMCTCMLDKPIHTDT